MSDQTFNEWKRSKEEEYFHKREQELIAKLRRRQELEAELKRLSNDLHSVDDDLMAELEAAGFTRDTVPLLHLTPLVYVAWAEGQVTEAEREQIFEVARLRGIEPGSAADQRLAEMLKKRPPQEFFDRSLRIISLLMQSLPEAERQASQQDLVSYSAAVASASGGLLGFGNKISEEERNALARVAAALQQAHRGAAEEIVKGE